MALRHGNFSSKLPPCRAKAEVFGPGHLVWLLDFPVPNRVGTRVSRNYRNAHCSCIILWVPIASESVVIIWWHASTRASQITHEGTGMAFISVATGLAVPGEKRCFSHDKAHNIMSCLYFRRLRKHQNARGQVLTEEGWSKKDNMLHCSSSDIHHITQKPGKNYACYCWRGI